MSNPLLDQEFLKQLYKQKEKEIYAKIVALNFAEEPIEEITGKITSGSINVDGNSAVRRTCSLSLLAYDIQLTDYYWGVKTKFNLSIGLKNCIDMKYPEIIWFPQGIFIITTFNSSQTVNAFNISLSGKDKMCLLNGEMSGNIHANSTRFDIIEEYDSITDTRTETKLPIKDIIKEMVHGHAGEPIHNIIVNDLDDYGLELLEYRGASPLYLLFKVIDDDGIEKTTDIVENILLTNPDEDNFKEDSDFKDLITLNGLFNGFEGKTWTTEVGGETKKYKVAKLEYGDAAGYRLTDLIYPGDLIANAGESVTSILDKIKNILGDFEYFYDIDGRFIFQRKKTYVSTSWNNLRTGSDGVVYAEAAAYQTPIVWNFEGNDMLISISNTPSLNNLKNDFSIWGTRKSVSGADIPIHLRYAVDKKPKKYKTIRDLTKKVKNADGTIKEETTRQKNIVYATIDYEGTDSDKIVDYRELIYQMALDYRKGNRDDSFVSDLIEKNPELCANGRTGYEQYYIDMEGFWRQLYDPDYDFDEKNPENDEYYATGDSQYWHKNVIQNPSVLNFWIDFLDTEGDIVKFSIPAIGDRAKVVNNNAIKSIYFKDTPLIIYHKGDDILGGTPTETLNQRYIKPGYSYAQLSNIEELFSISSQGKTAKEELDSLLYNYTYCTETISLNSIPIYSLQPNTHIFVKDDENISVNGEYIISHITIPLAYNGMMSISATKVPDKIL